MIGTIRKFWTLIAQQKLTTNSHEWTQVFYRRDEEDIRESGYQVAGHQENRTSGKGRAIGPLYSAKVAFLGDLRYASRISAALRKFWRCKKMQFG